MSDEEKKAVENIKAWVKFEEINGAKLTEFKLVLNLIEKQQKEIEELKKPKYIINCKTNEITKLTNDFVSKDTIKTIIEEVQKDLENSKDAIEANIILGKKLILQSLLKEE